MTRQADSQASDEFRTLIKRARCGETDATNELLAKLDGFAQGHAKRCLQSEPLVRESASDIVQESFWVAHQAIQEFKGESESQLKAWFSKIVGRKIIDMRRAKLALKRSGRIQHLSINDSGIQTQPIDPQETPRSRYLTRETHEILRQLIDELSSEAKRILKAKMDDKLTFEEIGELCGKTESQVRRLWYKSVAQLQKRFQEISSGQVDAESTPCD